MKVKRHIFNDNLRKSADHFRNILGLYFDYKDKNLTTKSNPLKSIYFDSFLEISNPELIDDSLGLYRQTVEFKPKDSPQNRNFLNSLYDEGGLESDAFYRTIDKAISDTVSDQTVKYLDLNCTTNWTTEEQNNIDDWFVKVYAKYNFYIEKYENLIQQQNISSEISEVPEEVLPNFYVVTLSLNRNLLDTISQQDYNSSLAVGTNSPYDNFYQKFDTFITLENNMFLNPLVQNTLLFGMILISYCEQYAQVYDKVSIDYIETAKKRFGSLFSNITNVELLKRLNEFKSSYPMYIEIKWTTDSIGPFTQFLENAGISLQSFQDFINNKLNIDIKDETFEQRKFVTIDTVNIDTFTQESELDLELYDIGRWTSNFLNDLLNGVNIDENAPETVTFLDGPLSLPSPDDSQSQMEFPIFDTVEDILNAVGAGTKLNEMLINASRSYKDIIDGKFAESEILFYKIEKRNEFNDLIQTFYVPNIIGVDIQEYIDTQVKYNKTYVYKIFAYTAIYGTEYYYKKDVPFIFIPQIMEPILDLNQSNQNVQDVGVQDSVGNNIEQIDATTLGVPFVSNPRFFDNSRSGFSQNNALPSAGGSAAQAAIPNSIGNLADNIESANQLEQEVQEAEIETAITTIYEDNLDVRFLEGYKFSVYYKPVAKLVELVYTDRVRAIIVDFPPTPPVVHFYPIKDCSTRFNIAVAPSSGEIKDIPKPIRPWDMAIYNSYLNNSYLSDDGKIIFKYEGEISKYEMFRVENAPENYTSFYTDETAISKVYTGYENFLFEEKIESNKYYYYTFRAYDFHDKFSNPSDVYKVKIYENDGVEYLDVSIYNFPKPKKNFNKSFKKYLKIDANLGQKTYSDKDEKLGLFNESVYNKDYVVRIKSKHSGKILDIIINFEKEDVN